MSNSPVPRRANEATPPQVGNAVLRSALLGNLHDAGVAIVRCAAGRDRESLFASPSLHEKIVECLEVMRVSARDMPEADKEEMENVDWRAWETLNTAAVGSPRQGRERLWQIITELVPTTLVEVRRYRRALPGWFEI